jgi:TonB-linked SusC/RagA family outer membrane protein
MLRGLLATLVAAALAPAALRAQAPAVVSGRVTSAAGQPEYAVSISIDALSVGTNTVADGTYRLVIPASRVRAGQQVGITARRVGLFTSTHRITLHPGAQVTQNFDLKNDAFELDRIVATGQGTNTTRVRSTATVNTVAARSIVESRETNLIAALAAKAPNVLSASTSGDPGAGAYVQIRGAASVVGGTQPLIVVDGTPIENGSYRIEDYDNDNPGAGGVTGTAVANRAADVNPADVADVQILKGGAATSLYGSRGANGVVLITTGSGRPGTSRASFTTSYGIDQVTRLVPLQTRYGQGVNRAPFGGLANEVDPDIVSYGAPIAPGTPVFDHAGEVYRRGMRREGTLALSGGSGRTTYYLSLGRLDHEGVIVGPQAYRRTTLRLKATHGFAEHLTLGGNVAYTRSAGDYVQQGSNISGIQLGALRTPPEFDNRPYLDPTTGLHRSFRCAAAPCVATLEEGRGYDNPFWVALEMPNTAEVDRVFGNLSLDYAPAPWVRVSYLLGGDYSLDERRSIFPKSSSDFPQGRMIRADLGTTMVESRLLATLERTFSPRATGTLTLGQSLNQTEFSRYQVNGNNLIYGAGQLDFAVDKITDEFRSTTRTEGYFANGEATLWDAVTVTGNLLYEGSSTFGGGGKRFLYPGVGASWQAGKLRLFDDVPWLDNLKLRANYGVSGRQPPVFASRGGYARGAFFDSWLNLGLESVYQGQDGVFTSPVLANPEIRPERKEEWEAGFDLAMLGGRLGLGFTYYQRATRDMVLEVPLPPSSGFRSQYRNAARVDNGGVELWLDLNPVERGNVSWTVSAQYARNRSCVRDLSGSEEVTLNGLAGSTVSLVAVEANDGECAPFGVFYGSDWVRFGRGLSNAQGERIDDVYDAPDGAVYIGPDGFPVEDPRSRILGDPNPDWTGSLRSSLVLFNSLRLSGLLDVSHGGEMWNGTRGALMFHGTHRESLPFQGAGTRGSFGDEFHPEWEVGGPGAGRDTTLNWANWTVGGPGSGFTGPASTFIEDAGFVKLRDVSVSYTLEREWLERRFGLSSATLSLSGRNLKTWTRYTGIDPESNLTGQSVGRGIDYFNNPQTRSWVVSVNLSH